MHNVARISYQRPGVEMSIRNMATGERIPPLHEALQMRDEAIARIAELEARLRR